MLHAPAGHQSGENSDGLLLFPFIEGGVDHGGGQHLAGGIHHGDLAAVAVSGIQTHGDKALHRGLHQQRLQIQGKIPDGALAGPVRQIGADLALQGGEDQPVIGVLRRGPDDGADVHGGLQGGPADQRGALVAGKGNGDLQNPFLFGPVDGHDLMVHHPGNRHGKIVIKTVNAVFFGVFRLADERCLAVHQLPEGFADGGVVGQVFGDDIGCTGEGFLRGMDALFFIDIVFGQNIGVQALLGENGGGQGFQTLLPGHGGAGAALLLIGTVQVLHLRHGGGGVDGGGQLVRQLALIFNGLLHLIPAGLEVAQVGQPGFQIPQGGVVHGSMHFFPVPGDEGNGVALVHQGDDILHIFQLLVQLLRENFRNSQHWVTPFDRTLPL